MRARTGSLRGNKSSGGIAAVIALLCCALACVGGAQGQQGLMRGGALDAGGSPDAALSPAGGLARADDAGCEAGWVGTFGQRPGVRDYVRAMVVGDLGDGPALYVGEGHTGRGIAKWDGEVWSTIRHDLTGTVRAMAIYDSGSGPELYAGGLFYSDYHGPRHYIVKWDGESWAPVGGDVDNMVFAFGVFDDGSGEALYAGGMFTTAGGTPAQHVAKWDGFKWTPLGDGIAGGSFPRIEAFEVFDSGDGPELYASGVFTMAGGAPASSIARWDGESWSAVGGGIGGRTPYGATMAVFDDGSGPALYVGGLTLEVGGVQVRGIAKWDGVSWSAVFEGGNSPGMAQRVVDLHVFDDGGGPALYAAGSFYPGPEPTGTGVARWTGEVWEVIDMDNGLLANCLTSFDAGQGERLFVGGDFNTIDSEVVNYIAEFHQGEWGPLGRGITAGALALLPHEDEHGPMMIAGGPISVYTGYHIVRFKRWQEGKWTDFANPLTGHLSMMHLFDDGGGPTVYAVGDFSGYDQGSFRGVAKWNGEAWVRLGSGVSIVDPNWGAIGSALEVYDDGDGDALYVGGWFRSAGDELVNHIAKWDGNAWSALGSGIEGQVRSLLAFEGPAGPSLLVGGIFTEAGAAPARNIAVWDGESWSTLGDGIQGMVDHLIVFDDGSGPMVYAGIGNAYAVPVDNGYIVRWTGDEWETVGGGFDSYVRSLVVFDDGTGPSLYAFGPFLHASGTPVRGAAKWDGESWTPFDSGFPGVYASIVRREGDEAAPSLHVAGGFSNSPARDDHLARYQGCPPAPCPADLNGDGVVDVTDLRSLLLRMGPCPARGECVGDLDNDGRVTGRDVAILVQAFGACP